MVHIRYLNIVLLLLSVMSHALAEERAEKSIVLAGGCFWCMEPPFDELRAQGVLDTTVGYSGGKVVNPKYDAVSAGSTGHYEVIKIQYDAKKISLEKLLQTFWRNIDPFDSKGQFCDKGDQYKSAIFYSTPEEKSATESSIKEIPELAKRKVETLILPVAQFYPAEDYHQDYYKKNPVRYKYYRTSCGRDKRLKEIWGTQVK